MKPKWKRRKKQQLETTNVKCHPDCVMLYYHIHSGTIIGSRCYCRSFIACHSIVFTFVCVFLLFVVSNCLLFTFFACVFLSCFTCHISCFLNNSLKMERTPVSIIVLLPHSTCNHRFKLFQLNLCFQLFVLVLYIE